MRTCYVDGSYVRENEATVSIFDRSFLFSDGVYEVSLVVQGTLIDNERHLKRLKRSCEKLGIQMPASEDDIIAIQKNLIEKNNLSDGLIYLQVSRGSEGDRDFLYSDDIKPTLIMFTQTKNMADTSLAEKGIKVITLPEIRWLKRDIKAVSLLGAVLAKTEAKRRGYQDAWFIEDGYFTEGSSNNIFLVKGNDIITKAANEQILNGITRQAVIEIAAKHQLNIIERDINLDDVHHADEAFVTSASLLVAPVTHVDDIILNDGKPGKIACAIREAYIKLAYEAAKTS